MDAPLLYLCQRDLTLWHLCRDDGLDADGIVDELKEIRLLRRIGVVHEKARCDLATAGIEHVPGVPASDCTDRADCLHLYRADCLHFVNDADTCPRLIPTSG